MASNSDELTELRDRVERLEKLVEILGLGMTQTSKILDGVLEELANG